MWYAIIILTGVMFGLYVASKNAKLRNIKEDEISNLLLFYFLSVLLVQGYIMSFFEWQNYKGKFYFNDKHKREDLRFYGAVSSCNCCLFLQQKERYKCKEFT